VNVMNERMRTGVVPSVAPAAMLCGCMVASEAAMILGGNEIPGRRDPVCLPHLIAADMTLLQCSVIHVDDLLRIGPEKGENHERTKSQSKPHERAVGAQKRRLHLVSAGDAPSGVLAVH